MKKLYLLYVIHLKGKKFKGFICWVHVTFITFTLWEHLFFKENKKKKREKFKNETFSSWDCLQKWICHPWLISWGGKKLPHTGGNSLKLYKVSNNKTLKSWRTVIIILRRNSTNNPHSVTLSNILVCALLPLIVFSFRLMLQYQVDNVANFKTLVMLMSFA